MARAFDEITPQISELLAAQHLFFVATAPSGTEGHVNLSPKGLDTFAVLGPNEVAYLDLTGSGAETIAHLRDNGRITLMFCTFEGPPNIVRLYGRGEAIPIADSPRPLSSPRDSPTTRAHARSSGSTSNASRPPAATQCRS